MISINIEKDKCNKDKVCITECPFNVLAADVDGFPEVKTELEAACMKCGHCLAVCPTGALTFNGISPEDCEPVQKGLELSEEAVAHLLKNRRSVRVYKNKPVPRETIANLLDMVRWAPTAKNVQPVYWNLVDDREKIRQMAGMTIEWLRQNKAFPDIVASWDNAGEDMILRDAPLLVIAHTAATALNPPADCAIAAASLELAASALGIGGCWAGFFMRAANNFDVLRNFLKLPEGHQVYAALMLGYPKFKYHRIPPREPAKVDWL